MTDDRWFRMCKDADNYLEHANASQLSDEHEWCSDWIIDELMGMYSWKYNVFQYPCKELNEYIIEEALVECGEWENGSDFVGTSWRDVWFQLVMWDRHGMTWNDEQSMWVKA